MTSAAVPGCQYISCQIIAIAKIRFQSRNVGAWDSINPDIETAMRDQNWDR